MTNNKRTVQFANFICLFGELEMLDLCDEVVIPAFTNEQNRRSFKDTSYFFHEVELITIEEKGKPSEPAIAGKFVKNTTLQREQIYQDGNLIKNIRKLPSAPSSFFVLILRDHKLLFLPEVSGAPSVESFRSTTEKFLKQSHTSFIQKTIDNLLMQDLSNENKRIQKK